MVNTDIFLRIGDQHKVCEDYIISGNYELPFIILADGCSSSKGTEMGARILCHLAKQYLRYRNNIQEIFFAGDKFDYYKMGNWIIHNAEMTARQLGLDITCLDSTLIISFIIKNILYVYIYGDGAIVTKDNLNYLYSDHIEFTNNAPYYLSYLIDEKRDNLYYLNKNEKSLIRTYQNGSSTRKNQAYDSEVILTYDLDEYSTIFICSDGIESFVKKDPTQRDILKIHDIAPKMMAFKNTKGEFLKRRMKKALNSLDKDGISHYDDLSIGAYLRTK